MYESAPVSVEYPKYDALYPIAVNTFGGNLLGMDRLMVGNRKLAILKMSLTLVALGLALGVQYTDIDRKLAASVKYVVLGVVCVHMVDFLYFTAGTAFRVFALRKRKLRFGIRSTKRYTKHVRLAAVLGLVTALAAPAGIAIAILRTDFRRTARFMPEFEWPETSDRQEDDDVAGDTPSESGEIRQATAAESQQNALAAEQNADVVAEEQVQQTTADALRALSCEALHMKMINGRCMQTHTSCDRQNKMLDAIRKQCVNQDVFCRSATFGKKKMCEQFCEKRKKILEPTGVCGETQASCEYEGKVLSDGVCIGHEKYCAKKGGKYHKKSNTCFTDFNDYCAAHIPSFTTIYDDVTDKCTLPTTLERIKKNCEDAGGVYARGGDKDHCVYSSESCAQVSKIYNSLDKQCKRCEELGGVFDGKDNCQFTEDSCNKANKILCNGRCESECIETEQSSMINRSRIKRIPRSGW